MRIVHFANESDNPIGREWDTGYAYYKNSGILCLCGHFYRTFDASTILGYGIDVVVNDTASEANVTCEGCREILDERGSEWLEKIEIAAYDEDLERTYKMCEQCDGGIASTGGPLCLDCTQRQEDIARDGREMSGWFI